MCQKAESVYSVVERYDNNTFRGQIRGIVGWVAGFSEDKSAAVYPNHDGKRLVRFFGGCPDICGEIIFALRSYCWSAGEAILTCVSKPGRIEVSFHGNLYKDNL
jgi:hypothetical protein